MLDLAFQYSSKQSGIYKGSLDHPSSSSRSLFSSSLLSLNCFIISRILRVGIREVSPPCPTFFGGLLQAFIHLSIPGMSTSLLGDSFSPAQAIYSLRYLPCRLCDASRSS